MDVKIQDFKTKLKQGITALPPCLAVYGDDAGQVRMLARQAAELVVPGLNDPFRVDRLSFDRIVQEPQLLSELAGTLPFGEGKRLVLVDDGIPETASQLKALQEALNIYFESPSPSSVVILALPYVEKTSALVKLIDKKQAAWGVRCYLAKQNFLKGDISTFFQKNNKRLDSQAIDFLMENLGNDAAITLSELTKLDLYTQGKSMITLEDCLQTVTSAPSVNMYKLCDAMGYRDLTQCELLLTEILEDADEYPLVLSMIYRHLKRIAECQAIAKTEAVNYVEAVTRLKPPVAPFAVNDFLKQVQNLPMARLQNLVDRFYQLQMQLRTLPGVEKTLVHRLILSTVA